MEKIALILGHPGHELRIYRFLELYKPVVFVLTDGSGNNGGASRIPSTLSILKTTGAQAGPIMGRFTDEAIYNMMLKQKLTPILALKEELKKYLKQENISCLAGDACEGYNPTHDLTRYLINAIAKDLNLKNYDFPLEAPPQSCPSNLKEQALWISLTDQDFERKWEAALGYKELGVDLQLTLDKYGKTPFLTECLRPVPNPKTFKAWETALPYYESYAQKKIATGKYKKVITYKEHLLPLAKALIE